MSIKFFKIYLTAILLSVAGWAGAARPSVSAKLDSVNLQMGRITTLTLTVTQDRNVKGSFPIFSRIGENGVISVCGDSVELRAPSRIDTVENGDRLKISYAVPVQSFDSGYYKLPEFVFVAGKDSVRSPSVALKVYPVGGVTAQTPISDYAGTADPANSSIFDSLPDFIYYYWWVLVLILLAIALGVWVLLRYRREGHILPKKPEPTPYELAVAALSELKSKNLWQQGMEKEYFTDLTDILRNYLYGRFGINAVEMTSRQILASLSNNDDTKDKKALVRQILDMADFVKFAKVRPLPEDNTLAFDNAVKFVEDTKPVLVEENTDEASACKEGDVAKKGGKK